MHQPLREQLRILPARLCVWSASMLLLTAISQGALTAPASTVETADESSSQPASHEAEWVVVRSQPGQGEQCLVCRKPILDANAVYIRYKGRLFSVNEQFLEKFAENPDRYFVQLQVVGALFDERTAADTPLHQAWLGLGLYVLIGLLAGGACGYVAVCKGLPPVPWFFAGLLLNVAALAVVMCKHRSPDFTAPAGIPAGLCKVPRTHTPVYCPRCGAENHPAAELCSGCNAAMQATVTPETDRI